MKYHYIYIIVSVIFLSLPCEKTKAESIETGNHFETLDTIPYWLGMDTLSSIGNIGIGTDVALSRLAVIGDCGVQGNIKAVEFEATPDIWPDYVFAPDYDLMSLSELERFILKNKHLPNVPSAAEVKEKGHSLIDTDIMLLEKVEELTLYLIEMDKKLNKIEKTINDHE